MTQSKTYKEWYEAKGKPVPKAGQRIKDRTLKYENTKTYCLENNIPIEYIGTMELLPDGTSRGYSFKYDNLVVVSHHEYKMGKANTLSNLRDIAHTVILAQQDVRKKGPDTDAARSAALHFPETTAPKGWDYVTA